MKKILVLTLLVCMIFSACGKNDNIKSDKHNDEKALGEPSTPFDSVQDVQSQAEVTTTEVVTTAPNVTTTVPTTTITTTASSPNTTKKPAVTTAPITTKKSVVTTTVPKVTSGKPVYKSIYFQNFPHNCPGPGWDWGYTKDDNGNMIPGTRTWFNSSTGWCILENGSVVNVWNTNNW